MGVLILVDRDVINKLFELNYFALFGLTVEFDINLKNLQDSYHSLQRKYHPDKFALTNSHELKDTMTELVAYINHAYKCLVNPITRVLEILRIYGISYKLDENNNNISQEFLYEQLELRELMSELLANNDEQAIASLTSTLANKTSELLQQISSECKQSNWNNVKELVTQINFYSKFENQLVKKG